MGWSRDGFRSSPFNTGIRRHNAKTAGSQEKWGTERPDVDVAVHVEVRESLGQSSVQQRNLHQAPTVGASMTANSMVLCLTSHSLSLSLSTYI